MRNGLSCLLIFTAAICFADENFPRIRFGGILDARFASTDDSSSWFDDGLGKTRYGGEDRGGKEVMRLSQASLVISSAFRQDISARLQLNVDAEPSRSWQRGRIDLIEAFVRYNPVLSSRIRLRIRGGIFFPPVSLENIGTAWNTPYTITTSAVNSWIGEEVRIHGAEFTTVLSGGLNEVALSVGAFGNNDPTGTLLAWRGWALHDRQTGLSDRLPLAPISAIQPGGFLSRQAPHAQPFREVDGKPGYYTAASWNRVGGLELTGLYYNNRGRQTEFDGLQYAWKTYFANFGLRFPIGPNVEVLSQVLGGRTAMGFGDMVAAKFYATYLLVSMTKGSNRVSLRYDNFNVEDDDSFRALDDNNEDGDAWTLCYIYNIRNLYRIAFELLRIHSERPIRAELNLPVETTELLFQASFRVQF